MPGARDAGAEDELPAERRRPESGYIGKEIPQLEIENCRRLPEGMSPTQITKLGEERYLRGETLYIQGDYPGAILEFIGSYCLVGYYTILKDIGQAFERDLQYEKAVAYLEKYVTAIKPEYKRVSTCAPDPQADKENVRRRVEVLLRLKARVLVETNPPDATVTIENDSGVAARGSTGAKLEVPGASYELVIERPGYVTRRDRVQLQMGQPYTYFYTLEPLKGRLSVSVTPADARVFLDDRFVGIGRVEEAVKSDTYALLVEAPGRVPVRRSVAVIAGEINRVQIEMQPKPQFGRRQLTVAATIVGGMSGGLLLSAFNTGSASFAGTVGGAAAGIAGSFLLLPEQVPLGASNLAITSSLVGGIAGGSLALLGTDDEGVVAPLVGAGLLLGATTGYLVGMRTKTSPGDAALINTSATWGTTAGVLFAVSFDPPRNVAAGLVLSGLGMGTVGGVLLSGYFNVSRTRAALIDLGGVLGIVGGVAAQSIVYPSTDSAARKQEHAANFALGGLAVGLVGAGILTRNLDAPKIPVAPTLGATTDASGVSVPTYGLGGSW